MFAARYQEAARFFPISTIFLSQLISTVLFYGRLRLSVGGSESRIFCLSDPSLLASSTLEMQFGLLASSSGPIFLMVFHD